MPAQKNFKKLVRGRMAKTGESYTAARSQFSPADPAAPSLPAPPVDGDPTAQALARALAAAGVVDPATGEPFSAELLFGVGGGIGFAYLVFVYPGWTTVHLDGRFNALYFEKTGFIETACARLALPLRVWPLTDRETAQTRLRKALAAAGEVAVTVDLTRIPGQVLPAEAPYAPHTVTVSGDEDGVAVTGLRGGPATMEWSALLDARWAGAKKYGGLFVFGQPTEPVETESAVAGAIGRTVDCLLEPSRSNFDGNFGVPGIRRWARLLTDVRDKKGWSKQFPEPEALQAALASVAKGLGGPGPSGDACRRLYASFLDEVGRAEAAESYRSLGNRWAEVVELAGRPGVTPAELADTLPDLADGEEAAAVSLRPA